MKVNDKIKLGIIVLILFSFILISCSPALDDSVSICLSITEPKNLLVDNSVECNNWTYSAIPLFESNYIVGKAIDRPLRAGDGISDPIGPFTQGKWRFELKGYADNYYEKMVLIGETEVELTKRMNIVSISMDKVEQEESYLSLEIIVPYISETQEIRLYFDGELYETLNEESECCWANTTINNNKNYLEFHKEYALETRWYELIIEFVDGEELIAKEILKIYPDCVVYGCIDTQKNSSLNISVICREKRPITIIYPEEAYVDEEITAVANFPISWYINDEFQEKTTAFTFTPRKSGTYTLNGIYDENGVYGSKEVEIWVKPAIVEEIEEINTVYIIENVSGISEITSEEILPLYNANNLNAITFISYLNQICETQEEIDEALEYYGFTRADINNIIDKTSFSLESKAQLKEFVIPEELASITQNDCQQNFIPSTTPVAAVYLEGSDGGNISFVSIEQQGDQYNLTIPLYEGDLITPTGDVINITLTEEGIMFDQEDFGLILLIGSSQEELIEEMRHLYLGVMAGFDMLNTIADMLVASPSYEGN